MDGQKAEQRDRQTVERNFIGCCLANVKRN